VILNFDEWTEDLLGHFFFNFFLPTGTYSFISVFVKHGSDLTGESPVLSWRICLSLLAVPNGEHKRKCFTLTMACAV